MKYASILCFIIIFCFPALAESPPVAPENVLKTDNIKNISNLPECKKHETARITVNIRKTADSFKELSDYMQSTRDSLLTEGAEFKINDIEIVKSEFNIELNNKRYNNNVNEGSYSLRGEISFETSMTDKSIMLATALSDKKFSVAYSEYMRRDYCPRK